MTQDRPTATAPTSNDAVALKDAVASRDAVASKDAVAPEDAASPRSTHLFVVQMQLSETCDPATVTPGPRSNGSTQGIARRGAPRDALHETPRDALLDTLREAPDADSIEGARVEPVAAPSRHRWRSALDKLEKTPEKPTGRPRQAWHMRILPDVLERLREHPNFTLQEELDGRAATDALSVHAVEEADREPTYQMELLRMFRERISLLAVLGIALLPIFSLFYSYLQPGTSDDVYTGPVLITHGLMIVACIILRFSAPRLGTLGAARLMSLVGYAIFCMGSAVVGVILSQNQFGDQAMGLRGIQFTVIASHSQIMLSILLMPYTVWESVVVAIIVTGTLAWSLWLPAPVDFQPIYISQMFVLVTTAFFVLCIAHFQNVLRRHAFDAAFDLARSAAQLQTLSTQDPVTGGYNRRHLEKMLAIEIARASRFARPLSVLMFDLDNFKQVNDTHGHATGDKVLRCVWESALSTVREIDTVARYGGDEFIAVLPEADSEAAHVIAERLQATARINLEHGFGGDSIEGNVTLSIGIATVRPTEPVAAESVIALADQRLYEAKRNGKNQIAL